MGVTKAEDKRSLDVKSEYAEIINALDTVINAFDSARLAQGKIWISQEKLSIIIKLRDQYIVAYKAEKS